MSEMELLKKEIELLKKEIELIKADKPNIIYIPYIQPNYFGYPYAPQLPYEVTCSNN